MDLSEYKPAPLSPWQREQAFRREGSSGAVVTGYFVDGYESSSYTMTGRQLGINHDAVRVFVRAASDVKQVAGMLRAMAVELERVKLER